MFEWHILLPQCDWQLLLYINRKGLKVLLQGGHKSKFPTDLLYYRLLHNEWGLGLIYGVYRWQILKAI